MLRFLGADAPLEGAGAAIQGLPYEGGISFRPGTAQGPRAIREMSDSIETWSPLLGKDLEDALLHDAGDVPLDGLEPAKAMTAVAEATERLARGARIAVSLGGDHSVSIGTTRGTRRAYPDLAHLVLDAHLDMRPSYDGSEYSHACGTWHMSGAGPTVVLGARSGERAEWEAARERLAGLSMDLELPHEGRRALEGRPVHLSLDIDVIDPGLLPGVGNPEAGGFTFTEVRDALVGLDWMNLVAMDLVEVSPNLDPSGVSASTAAKLLREVLCARLA